MPERSRPAICLTLAVIASLLGAPCGARAADLFAALGGKAGTAAIADGTLDRAVRDPRIAPIFEDVDVGHIKTELAIQLCQVAGGPCQYHGLSMRDAHLGYGIRASDFNALVEDMEASMSALGISWHAQRMLLARLAPMEPEVVTR
jgi:hemoglobin